MKSYIVIDEGKNNIFELTEKMRMLLGLLIELTLKILKPHMPGAHYKANFFKGWPLPLLNWHIQKGTYWLRL